MINGFFAIEGIDGSGKSTVAVQVVDMLNAQGHNAVYLREPTYDSEAGRTVRNYLDNHVKIDGNELLELFIADRRYDVEKNILPALRADKTVIMDRYFLSNAVYEHSDDFMWWQILNINRCRFPEPDMWFFLNPGVELAWARIILRGEAISQYETVAELKRTQQLYEEAITCDTHGKYITIKGDKLAYLTSGEIVKYIKNILSTQEEEYKLKVPITCAKENHSY